MIVSYLVDEDNKVTWWGFPLKEGLPTIDVMSPDAQIHIGFSQIIDGKLIENFDEYEANRLARKEAAEEKFRIMFSKN